MRPESTDGQSAADLVGGTTVQSRRLRGYFAVGAERISKPLNLGNLMRSAHAFGASFVFTVAAHRTIAASPEDLAKADTSKAPDHMPYYVWDDIAQMALPQGCELVGIELTPDAVDLPSFRHPLRAAYVLGAERGSLTPAMIARCHHIVRIPTQFCINVATAGAIVMYDRVRTLGRFAAPPVSAGGAVEPLPIHVHGVPANLTPAP
jgi:tRNA G18 (ribose-2'-O)-methylase SpoU